MGLETDQKAENKENQVIQCNVCFDAINTYGVIKCGHIYCFNCIRSWANRINKCPLCKAKFNVIKKIDGRNADFIKIGDKEMEVEEEIDPAMFGGLNSQ